MRKFNFAETLVVSVATMLIAGAAVIAAVVAFVPAG
jgi:hypothetical protein